MVLEARPANCCSSTFVLKIDDRPVGKYEGRWFSESLDVDLLGRRHLEFRKVGWLGSQFELVEPASGITLGRCDRSGMFTSSWDLTTSTGAGVLVRAGWFATGYEFKEADQVLASVDRLGWCQRGWSVVQNHSLAEEDLLLIGLVYHVVLQRQARQSHAGPHGAGS
jgi:hypothetical protein